MALGGVFFFFPLNLIQVQGYSATAAGAATLPFILIMFSLSRWSGGLVSRYGAKLPLVIGPVIAAIGFLLFALPGIGGSYSTTFFPAIVVLGFGMAISVAPLTTTVMGSVTQARAGVASGINNAVSRTAGLLAVAILGIVMLQAFNARLNQSLKSIEITPSVRQELDAQRIRLAAAKAPADLNPGQRVELERAIAESFVYGFRVVMLIAAGLALLSAIAAWVLIEGKSSPAPVTNRRAVPAPG
jgi:MFS family permease